MFKQKLFFVCILKVNDEKSRIRIPDPDPLVKCMDQRIRIRIHSKMSWIRNTAYLACECCSSFAIVDPLARSVIQEVNTARGSPIKPGLRIRIHFIRIRIQHF
jgi:hypothetical protein